MHNNIYMCTLVSLIYKKIKRQRDLSLLMNAWHGEEK